MNAASVEPAVEPKGTTIRIFSVVDMEVGDGRNGVSSCVPEHFLARMGLPPLPDANKPYNDASKLPILTCEVEIAPGTKVKAWAIDRYVIVGAAGRNGSQIYAHGRKIEEVAPFIKVEAIGKAEHKTVVRDVPVEGSRYWNRTERKPVIDTYGGSFDHHRQRTTPGIPWNYLRVRVTIDSKAIVSDPPFNVTQEDITVKFPRPEGGDVDLETFGPGRDRFQVAQDFFGLPLAWEESIGNEQNDHYDSDTDYRWVRTHRLLQDGFTIKQGKDALWAVFLKRYEDRAKANKGIKATLAKKGIRENIAKLQTEDPLLWSYLVWLHDERTRQGVSNNTLLAAFLESSGKDYETLRAALQESMAGAIKGTASVAYSYSTPETRSICLALPGAKDKDEEKRAAKEWYLRKSSREQAIGLGVSPVGHPKLLAAIESGDIPLGIFHKSGDQLHLINVEFDLWETALKRDGWADVLSQIAKNASGRTTYEKNITPYIAFLFRIEKYLDRHTGKGKKWRAMPSFVNSEWQLEMDEATEEGTVKKRSALTPIPDNETRTITVPYVAMRISGVRTTFCYSLDYQVFEEYTIDRESGTPIVNELEHKLNGRDDYGLMYFTLTGTPVNTGYPAFLIIFERLKAGTRVHFHRVHPCRSKDGKPTPACRLVEECYRYMAGNIRAEEIYAQQGDLIFIKTEQTVEIPADAKRVKEFESHAFKPMEDKPILLIPNEAKSIKNRLGFIYSEGIFMVDHPEHEALKGIPAGLYEVRRCKSFEANPKAVWSLTID